MYGFWKYTVKKNLTVVFTVKKYIIFYIIIELKFTVKKLAAVVASTLV